MPKLSYSKTSDAAYLAFGTIRAAEVAESIPLTDTLVLDVAEDGTVLGLEILDAKTFFADMGSVFAGRLELPERIDRETFDPASLFPAAHV